MRVQINSAVGRAFTMNVANLGLIPGCTITLVPVKSSLKKYTNYFKEVRVRDSTRVKEV